MNNKSEFKRRSTKELVLEAVRIAKKIKEETLAEVTFFDDIEKVAYSYLFKGIESVALTDYVEWAHTNNPFEEATHLVREYMGQMAEQSKCMVKCPSLGLNDWVLWSELGED